MDAQRREAIAEWDDRSFSDGFAGLRRVVDDGFSGAATDGTGWLFLVDGRVVGVVDAALDAFAEASGTVYRAPDDALPVLFAMQELGGEPRAKYYTKDTPLDEADRKLSQGGFTGYIELSENVLSGDYYVAYTGGESMAAAYVGNARRLETGDDAFDLAADEVGIYTVYEVDLDVRPLPDGDEAGESGAAADPTAAGGSDAASDEADESTDEPASPGAAPEADETDDRPGAPDEPGDGAGRGDGPSPTNRSDEPTGVDVRTAESDRDGADPSDGSDETDRPASDAVRIGDADSDGRDADGAAGADRTGRAPADSDGAAASDAGAADGDAPDSDDVFSEEAEWREQKSIPALDPSEAGGEPRSGGGRRGASSQRSRSANDRARTGRSGSDANGGSPSPRATETPSSNPSAVSKREAAADADPERVRKLEAALEETETERQSLADERDRLAAERDEIESERDELAEAVDRLESEVEDLREERDRLRDELSNARERLPEAERTLTPGEAREGTNLFIRYDSKEGATLADAHEGAADREALRENLRVEHHTSFETDGLAVDGRPFEEFLQDTIEYGFTRWLVEDLPFEVRGTGNEGTLRDLYDALPEIDRAEIGGTVSIAIREGGEETREQRAFDLVLRDRMGHPLFVADLNDSRDPTAEGTLESLVENGRDIAASNETFAGAFAVTESFFEPGALETASDAVGGGLFSRSKRASFVKLSRKQGYHLCLVEARDGGFHMTVPDL
ncbi:hypothetical protein [Halorubrum sp. Atlit-28R]|uniref:DUF7527 domain-containing protein n=1 Tax=Halorubrum sp. Atlit-28R TaxID=2282129 RepID=UPI000EF26722|nr:hypothetical protein [Halorubrum sp. Atlit-28R]RLM51569.1 hypothetical protein DVK06_04010 [Halorubrum sp. Atlit-28R]